MRALQLSAAHIKELDPGRSLLGSRGPHILPASHGLLGHRQHAGCGHIMQAVQPETAPCSSSLPCVDGSYQDRKNIPDLGVYLQAWHLPSV